MHTHGVVFLLEQDLDGLTHDMRTRSACRRCGKEVLICGFSRSIAAASVRPKNTHRPTELFTAPVCRRLWDHEAVRT